MRDRFEVRHVRFSGSSDEEHGGALEVMLFALPQVDAVLLHVEVGVHERAEVLDET